MGKKIIIIGGGVAGLSAGIYGRLNGFETEIIEMHTIPGGQCTAWDRKGYRFDYCLHWLVGTARGQFNTIWKETGVIDNKTKIINHDIFNKLYDDKWGEFYIYSDIDKWKQYLLMMAPEDFKAINKICSDMKKAAGLDALMMLRDEKSFKNIGSIFSFLILMIRYSKKNYKDYYDKFELKNEKLKYFLGSLFGESDFSAIAFLMMLAWFHSKNAGYLLGGSLPLAERMAQKYSLLGGKITFDKKVDRIIVENDKANGVILKDGTQLRADYIISAADGHSTIYEMLGGRYLSKQIEDAYNNWDVFTPLVQVSFGIKKEIPAECPSFTILNDNTSIGSTKLERGYSFMNYSFDPSMAPKGKTAIVLRFESPWSIWEKLDGKDYKEEKKKIEQGARILLEKQYPGISEYIEVVDVATPKTDVEYTGVWNGSYEGFLPGSKNIMKRIKNKLPGLNNFYMAGQWLTPGGGLPPSVESGKTAIKEICKEESKKK